MEKKDDSLSINELFNTIATPLRNYILGLLENDFATRYSKEYKEFCEKEIECFKDVKSAYEKRQVLLYSYLDALGYRELYNALFTAHVETTSRVLKEADLKMRVDARRKFKEAGYAEFNQQAN